MGPDEFVEPHYPGFIRIQIFSGAKPAKVDNPAPAAATHLGTIYVPDFKPLPAETAKSDPTYPH